MMGSLINELKTLQGKTIAVVYIFEGEDAPGFGHYHIWQSDVISGWLNAIQTIHCRPYILDVRTFIEKAVNGSLPSIDYVINLNCGSTNLSAMGLVPSVCGFLGVPCIPCGTSSIIAGEDKYISNLIALARGFNTPKELPNTDPRGIYRPLNCGSSVGVKRGANTKLYRDGTYQEFIQGFDMTTPIVYSPLTDDYELMPSVLIIPDTGNTEWFYGEEQKEGGGYHKKIVTYISPEVSNLYKDIVRAFSINTYCRIDTRVKCKSLDCLEDLLNNALSLQDVYFLEINPMPSIRLLNNDFNLSYQHIQGSKTFQKLVDDVTCLWGDCTLNTFLLVSSLFSISRAKYKKQTGCNHI